MLILWESRLPASRFGSSTLFPKLLDGSVPVDHSLYVFFPAQYDFVREICWATAKNYRLNLKISFPRQFILSRIPISKTFRHLFAPIQMLKKSLI